MAARQRFRWFHQVRGLTSGERNVLEYLSRVADDDGEIKNGVYSRTIAMRCEMTQNHVFKVLRSLQEKKKFVKSRTNRPSKKLPKRAANAYALDLTRYRPAGDDAGLVMWRAITAEMLTADSAVRFHADKSDAWYNRKSKTLTVWFESASAHSFFVSEIKKLLRICHAKTPKIKLLEFLGKLPPSDFDA